MWFPPLRAKSAGIAMPSPSVGAGHYPAWRSSRSSEGRMSNMRSRDPRLPAENELRTVEIRRDPFDVAEAPATQIWALYPLAHPAEQRPEPPSADLLRMVPEVARLGRRFLAIGAFLGFAFGAFYLLVA